MIDFILGFQNVVVDMEKVVLELEEFGVDLYIFDLCNNFVCV